MPLGYNPSDYVEPEKWAPRPGRYSFKIEEIAEKTFSTGAKGVAVKLLVDTGGKFDDTCYDNITYGEAMLWKLRHLCESVGVSFDPPPEPYELMNRSGRADFGTKEYNGYTNLRVKDYIKREESSGGVSPSVNSDIDDDDVPF